jgi:hypothetical protein
VRVLVLDPEYPNSTDSYARLRDAEEKNAPGQIAQDVEAFIEQARHQFGGTFPSTFQIKKYRSIPTINIFRVDNDLFWGPYLLGRQSRNTPTFVVRRGSILFSAMNDHFEKLWGDGARTVSVS